MPPKKDLDAKLSDDELLNAAAEDPDSVATGTPKLDLGDDIGGEPEAEEPEVEEPEAEEPEAEEPEAEEPEAEEPEAEEPEAEEPEAEEPKAEEPEATSPQAWIPKGRFDARGDKIREQHERLEALQRELNELKSQRPAEAPKPTAQPAGQASEVPGDGFSFDFDAAERDFIRATVDGEEEKAFEIRKTIRAAEREAAALQSNEYATVSAEQLRMEQQIIAVSNRLVEAYPAFDPASDSFDEALTRETTELRDAYIAKGMSPPDAIEKAVDLMAKANGLNNYTPPAAPAPKKPAVNPESVKRGMEAARRQPPSPTARTSGADIGAIDVNGISEEEWDSLPASKRSELLGDAA